MLRTYQIILFTVRFSFKCKEWFPLQMCLALMTCKTSDVINFIHSSATTALVDNILLAFLTHTQYVLIRQSIHALHQQVSQCIHLFLLAGLTS